MIVFKKLKWKNFLSTGNIFTEVDLNSSNTTLIVGENGSGKCLRGSTEVEVSFEDNETEKKLKKFLNSQ
jgi:predicted ATP-binding protein involved in virulence